MKEIAQIITAIVALIITITVIKLMIDDKNMRIGQLRQWLNEERITDPKKMVTDEELITWLK